MMPVSMNDGLVSILENELGAIETGMDVKENTSVQIVKYDWTEGRPKFLSSLGLSNVSIPKFEWIMEFSPDLAENNAASVLGHYLDFYLQKKIEAPKRGSYVLFPSPTDRVWENDNSRGLYFTNPV